MCLDVKEKAKCITAKEDIVVYKRIYSYSSKIDVDKIKNGDYFTGVIKYHKCSGIIHKSKGGEIWFCTNDTKLDGDKSPDMLGYLFSWRLDDLVTSVIINDVEMVNDCRYKTPYRDFEVNIGNTYTSRLIKNRYSVETGLHSFKNLKDAINDGYGVYAKCVIPKGSKYYIGKFGCSISYASDTLKYIEIVRNYRYE